MKEREVGLGLGLGSITQKILNTIPKVFFSFLFMSLVCNGSSCLLMSFDVYSCLLMSPHVSHVSTSLFMSSHVFLCLFISLNVSSCVLMSRDVSQCLAMSRDVSQCLNSLPLLPNSLVSQFYHCTCPPARDLGSRV